MIPYILVLLFVMVWMSLEKEATNRISCWVPIIVLSVFAGIRSYLVGTDSGNYAKNFIRNLPAYGYSFKEDEEFLFQLFEYGLLHITHNYFWLFFLSALAVVTSYLLILKKFSTNYILSVYIFICGGTYTFFFNGLRQGLAMAIVSLATPYLIEKKHIPFILISIFAAQFHISALFIIPFYFICNAPIRNFYKPIVSFIISLIGSSIILAYIASTNPRYESYAELSNKSGGLVTLSFFTILMILLWITKYIYKIKEGNFESLLIYYSTGVSFIIPLALLGSNPSGPQRLLFYFTWTLALLIPTALRKINDNFVSSITLFVLFVYFILTTKAFSNLSPYLLNPIFKVF